jgi:disulfide bond formation protein DsbB
MLAPPLSEGAARLKQARLLALLVPFGLLGGALFSQYVGGLYPCEMCYWQRWPHAAAILLAIGAYWSASNLARSRMLVMLAALAVAASGAIGVFHAGVEIGWWEGITQCTATGATSLQDIMNVPLFRCDQVQWEFLVISMPGWNAIISLTGAAAIVALARRGA